MNQFFKSRHRTRTTPEERAHLVQLFRQSNLTATAFAREHRLKIGTFNQWLYKRQLRPPVTAPVSLFQEITLPSDGSSEWAAEIRLGANTVVRLGPDAAASLVDQLVQNPKLWRQEQSHA